MNVPNKVVSHIYLNSFVSKSYHPPIYIHCLNNSIAGIEPSGSLKGIFKSSINITISPSSAK